MDAKSLEVCDFGSKLTFELVYFLGLLWMLVFHVAVCCDLALHSLLLLFIGGASTFISWGTRWSITLSLSSACFCPFLE